MISERPLLHLSSGSSLKSADGLGSSKLAFSVNGTRKSCRLSRPLTVQASYSDGGRPSSGSAFVSGFVLGGLIVGTLGCVYAPQISKALTGTLNGTDKKDLMKKLPKFLYDEEKALEPWLPMQHWHLQESQQPLDFPQKLLILSLHNASLRSWRWRNSPAFGQVVA